MTVSRTRFKRKRARAPRTPDEVIRTERDGLYILCDDLPGPLYAKRQPYWTQNWMAGRFHPNLYHPPLGRVQVQTRWGMRARRVITEQVPSAYAHLPQYQNGRWSYIEGF